MPEVKKITATLKRNADDKDILEFDIANRPFIDLSSQDQSVLSELFSKILAELIHSKLEIVYVTDDAYPQKNNLIDEVCKEYVEQLNEEIGRVAIDLPFSEESDQATEETK